MLTVTLTNLLVGTGICLLLANGAVPTLAQSSAEGQRQCGNKLASTLEWVCAGKYQGLYSKRSTSAGSFGDSQTTSTGRLIAEHHNEQRPFYETLPYAWQAWRHHKLTTAALAESGIMNNADSEYEASEPQQQLLRFRRSDNQKFGWYLRNTIVKECCMNACTFQQMMDYCLQ